MKGGTRPGAGRPKGGKNKITHAVKAKLAAIIASGEELPLEFLLREMRAEPPEQRDGENVHAYKVRYEEWGRRTMVAAQAAVGYCHNRLTSIEHKGEGGGPIVTRVELVFVKGSDTARK